jgi:hypothetical protein
MFIIRDDKFDGSNCGYDCDDNYTTVLAVFLIITLYGKHAIKLQTNTIVP